jgi:long-chain acyl-CoA synthetase
MTVNRASTIPALFHSRVSATPSGVALQQFDAAKGSVSDRVTWSMWRDASTDVAGALISSGAHRGETVAVLAHNTTLWPIADVGIILAGLVSVGIQPTASVEQVHEILSDCAASVVIVEGHAQLDKVRTALESSAHPPLIVAAGVGNGEESGTPRIVSWETWLARGRYALVDGSNVATQLTRRGAVASPDDLAMLIYTSGQTGASKGARITHAYVVEAARSLRDTLGLGGADSAVSYLPFSDATERIFGLYTRIACGMTGTLVADDHDVWSASRVARPTIFGGRAPLYEELYNALLLARKGTTPTEGQRWDRAVDVGMRRARLLRQGDDVPVALEEQWMDDIRIVRPILTRHFGDALRIATSSGAPLRSEIAEYLDACGVTVLGSYGRMEHLCIAFNRPEKYRHDSVGVAMPGTSLAVAHDGEILVRRGDLTFAGYHRRALESQEAFTEDGVWFRTGDIGGIDSQGFVRIATRNRALGTSPGRASDSPLTPDR